MATSRPRMYTVHRREYGILYICHSAVMDGEARTSAAIYFHANNARVNRRGSGREHAHSRLPVPTLKQHLTSESRVPSGQRGVGRCRGGPRMKYRGTAEEKRVVERILGVQRGKRAKNGWQRMDGLFGGFFFSKCDLRSLTSFSSDVYCNDDISSNKMMSNDALITFS